MCVGGGGGGRTKVRCTHILPPQRHKPCHVRTQTSENNDGSKTLTSEWWEGQEKKKKKKKKKGGGGGEEDDERNKCERVEFGGWGGSGEGGGGVRKAFQYNLRKGSRAPVSGPGRQTY